MSNIKSLLVEFIVAFLLGIAGNIAIFYIAVLMSILGIYPYFSFMSGIAIAILAGIPLGSSLGIVITKKYIFRTGKLSVLCLFTSLVFGFLAAFLCGVLEVYGLIGPGSSEIIVFLLVPLFALIGYNAMEMLLRRRKESGRSAPQKHLNDRDSSPVIEKQSQ